MFIKLPAAIKIFSEKNEINLINYMIYINFYFNLSK